MNIFFPDCVWTPWFSAGTATTEALWEPYSFFMAEPSLLNPREDTQAALNGAKLFLPPHEVSRKVFLELGGGGNFGAALKSQQGKIFAASSDPTPVGDALPITSEMRDRIAAILQQLKASGRTVTVSDELETLGSDPDFNGRPDFQTRCFQGAYARLWENKMRGEAVDEEQMARLSKLLSRFDTVIVSAMPMILEEGRRTLAAAGVSDHTLAALVAPLAKDQAHFRLESKPADLQVTSPSLAAISALDVELHSYPEALPMPGLIGPDGELLLVSPQRTGPGKFTRVPIASGVGKVRCLATGGMGLLFVAELKDPMAAEKDVSPLPVVVKTLRVEFASDPHIRRRFLLEEWVGRLLRHPNILSVLHFSWTQDGRPAILMPYQRGWVSNPAIKDLGALLRYQGPLDIDFAVETVFHPASDALMYAHEQGVYHRDLKPGNLVIDQEHGKPVFRIMDFGVAYLVGHPDYDLPGTAPGTPGYMSSRAQKGGDVGEEADVFALGVTMYEVLTGKHPVDTTSYKDLKGKDLALLPAKRWLSEVQPPRLLRFNIPVELERIVLRAMGYTPEDQMRLGLPKEETAQPFQRAEELRNALYYWMESRKAKKEAADSIRAARALREQARELRLEEMSVAQFEIWRRRAELAIASYDLALAKLKGHDKEIGEERWSLLWELFEEAERFGMEGPYEPRLVANKELTQRAQEPGKFSMKMDAPSGNLRLELVTFRNEEGVFRESKSGPVTPTLPKGVYALRVQGSGVAPMQIPFLIRRGETTELNFRVYQKSEVPDGFAVVPAGKVITDAEPYFYGSKPKETEEISQDFFVKKTMVTNREYVDFLNDLISVGSVDEALARLPRDSRGTSLWHQEVVDAIARGEFINEEIYFSKSGSSDKAGPVNGDAPVIWISTEDAVAWAAWVSTSAMRFELPSRRELLYLMRGRDARKRPWGEDLLPEGAANVKTPHYQAVGGKKRIDVTSVGEFPLDASPFGPIQDIFGNAREFTRDTEQLEDGNIFYFSAGCGYNQNGDANLVVADPFFPNRPLPHGFRVVVHPKPDVQ